MNYAFLCDPVFSDITRAGVRGGAGADSRTVGGVDYWTIHDDELRNALRTRWRYIPDGAGDHPDYPAIIRIAATLANDPEVIGKLQRNMAMWRSYDRKGHYTASKIYPTLCRVAHAHLRAYGHCLTYEATVGVAVCWESFIWVELQGLATQGMAGIKRWENAPGVNLFKLQYPHLMEL